MKQIIRFFLSITCILTGLVLILGLFSGSQTQAQTAIPVSSPQAVSSPGSGSTACTTSEDTGTVLSTITICGIIYAGDNNGGRTPLAGATVGVVKAVTNETILGQQTTSYQDGTFNLPNVVVADHLATATSLQVLGRHPQYKDATAFASIRKQINRVEITLLPKPQCSNGLDDDGDSKIDYPNDPGCTAIFDEGEQDDCQSLTATNTLTPCSQTATLDGKILLGESEFPLKDYKIRVFSLNGQAVGTDVTNPSDGQGHYRIENLPIGDVQVSATPLYDNMDPVEKLIKLVAGVNTLDFKIPIGPDNEIRGTVTTLVNGVSQKVPGQKVVVKSVDIDKVVGSAVSDTNGKYVFKFRKERPTKGTFKVYGETKGQIVSNEVTVPLTNAYNSLAYADIKVNQQRDDKYNLDVVAIDKGPSPFAGPERIAGATIEIDKTTGGAYKKATTNDYGWATFVGLSPGNYVIKGSKTSYQDGFTQVTLIGDPAYFSNATPVFLLNSSKTCEKHPQSNVDFWFCGKQAKALYSERMGAWSAMNSKIGTLRGTSAWNLYQKIPLQIVVDSSNVINTVTQTGDPGCPLTLADQGPNLPPKGETVYLTVGIVKAQTDAQLQQIAEHEGQHVHDARKQGCVGLWSEKSGFKDLYNYAAVHYGESYFKQLNEKTYDSSLVSGHTAQGIPEAYASSFTSKREFSTFPGNVTGQLRDLLSKTADLAEQP